MAGTLVSMPLTGVTNFASLGHSRKKSAILISSPASMVTVLIMFLSASLIVNMTDTVTIAATYKNPVIFPIIFFIKLSR